MEKIINQITNAIWKQGTEIMWDGNKRMTNAEYVMIQHYNNKIILGEWGNLGCAYGSSTKMIRTWYNYTYSKKQIRDQVEEFVGYCKQEGLEIDC